MRIEGTVKRIEREAIEAPADGVHDMNADGTIKGTRSIYINDVLVPYGRMGFYWRLGDIGYKVYWSFRHNKVRRSYREILRTYKWMRKAHARGICPKAYKVKRVDLVLDGVKHSTYAIKVKHVHYPEDAWEKFSQGQPYDWNCLDPKEHPNHSAKGYKKFNSKLRKKMKIGDVIYCTRAKRWYLVDCD